MEPPKLKIKITKLKLEEKLHFEFKSKVTGNGSNMQETMVKLIENYLKEENEKSK